MDEVAGGAPDAGGAATNLVEARSSFSAALDDLAVGGSAAAVDGPPGDRPAARSEAEMYDAAERFARTRYGGFADALDRLDPDVAGALTQLAHLYATDPATAADMLADVFYGSDEDPQPLTIDDVREEMRGEIEAHAARIERQQAVEEGRGEIRAMAERLGFALDTDEYQQLLSTAHLRYGHLSYSDAIEAAAAEMRPATSTPRRAGGNKAKSGAGPSSVNEATRQVRAELDRLWKNVKE